MGWNPSDWALVRVGVATPELRLADIDFNLMQLRQVATEAAQQGCQFLLTPELGVTGYSCGDLFLQPLLIEKARTALVDLAALSAEPFLPLVVGLPRALDGALYNVAALLADGKVCGVVPKRWLPNSQEFYEQRWFTAAHDALPSILDWNGESIPFGTDLLFAADNRPDCVVGIELCEDLWVARPPSADQALAGATLLVNPSASPEILGKAEYRRNLVASQSARCLAAYLYASAGPGESSTDLVFSGHSLIAEYGVVLAETERFSFSSTLALADVDLERLGNERRRSSTFAPTPAGRCIPFALAEREVATLLRPVSPSPFVPNGESERSSRCQEIFALQTTALARRLRHTSAKTVVIGISGGLDSTLALLVTVKAFDRLGLDRQGIVAITMPGFGTTGRTRGNAEALAEHLGVTLRIVSIDASVRQHFSDIGHDPLRHDITYENCQARERTQILMDVANQVGGLVIGTGDLSELALGWCTYNGDHMSMYAVNSGVPKTLVRYLVSWCAESEFPVDAATVLHDIVETPVSPELLPPTESGEIAQKTEETVGPYLLHDFFLYQVVRLGYPPRKVLFMAEQAFSGDFSRDELLHWLRNFYQRFFSQQFKRSCLPDGPKVGSVALSPRGDWRMPSDACAALWLAELEGL